MSVRRLALAALVALAAPAAAQQPAPVRWGIAVHPDTVTVGQPFTIAIHVIAPAGASVEFPAAPDSNSAVLRLDPRVLSRGNSSGAVDRTATYRVAAWDVGAQGLGLGDILVHRGAQVQHISLERATVFVKSVLPDDSAKRVPKPARDIFTGWAFPWWVLFVLAAILLVAWLTRRRRRDEAAAVPALTPFERAEREFTRVAALGLVEAGERGRFVALSVEVLRDYLVARFPLATLSLTTRELMRELEGATTVPITRLEALLVAADMVKFGRGPLTADRAIALGREAQAIVRDENLASEPGPEREAA